MIFQKQKLSNLLNNTQTNDPLIKYSIKAYKKHGLLSYIKGNKVPIENVYEIYKRRYDNLRDIKNESIDGFEDLLKNLKLSQEKFVRIHSFEISKETFILFTDSKIKKFIGVLIIKDADQSTEHRY